MEVQSHLRALNFEFVDPCQQYQENSCLLCKDSFQPALLGDLTLCASLQAEDPYSCRIPEYYRYQQWSESFYNDYQTLKFTKNGLGNYLCLPIAAQTYDQPASRFAPKETNQDNANFKTFQGINSKRRALASIGSQCGENLVYKWNADLLNQESSFLLPDESLLTCSLCSEAIPACQSCSSLNSCDQCKVGAFQVGNACFYNFCGFGGKGVNYQTGFCATTCSIGDCDECMFSSTGSETCKLCNPGFTLSQNKLTCIEQTGTYTMNLYVLSLSYSSGLLMSDSDIQKMQSPSPTFGESLSEPFRFVQQVHNTINTLKADTIAKYSEVTVNVYLGQGDHFLFDCADGFNADLSAYSSTELTDLCSVIPTLQSVYTVHDTVTFNYQPLDLGGPKPTIHQVDAHSFFNVTKSLTVTGIAFQGTSLQAVYTDTPNKDLSVREFSHVLCTWSDSTDTFISDSTLPISYKCQQHLVEEDCSNSTNTRCSGEPYSSTYFNVYGSTAKARRSTLFNLYAFDSKHTKILKTPALTIIDCTFSQFLTGTQESLINIETLNIWSQEKDPDPTVNDGEGNLLRLGTDNGASINITSSTFTHLRLCKGLIVYRQGPNFDSVGILDYQAQSQQQSTCTQCKIVISESTFTSTNFKQLLRSIRPLYDLELGQRLSERVDSSQLTSGSVRVPLFQNFGSILNVEDFQGPIEFSSCTVQKNLITVPDLQFGVNDTSTTDSFNFLSYYRDLVQNNYQTNVCKSNSPKYSILVQGISQTDPDTLFTELERHQVIYISRPRYPVLFVDNTFSENMGLFGGAITINSPDFSQVTVNDASSKKPFIIFKGNTFTNNMAYVSGNAVYVRMTRPVNKKTYFCGAIRMDQEIYQGNFGTKLSSGTVTVVCDLVVDSKTRDYTQSSAFLDSSLATFVSDPILDLINPSFSYYPAKTRSYFTDVNFKGNFVGKRGSALYLSSVSVTIKDSVFQENGAVDAFQEQNNLPPYTKYILGMNGLIPNSLFTVQQDLPCQKYEFSYLVNCVSSGGVSVKESQVQGAIYYRGSGVQGVQDSLTVKESLSIISSEFTDNSVGIPLFSGDLSSSLYIVNAQRISVESTLFQQVLISEFGSQVVKINSQSLFTFFPPGYFNNILAPLIRIKYDTNAQTVDSTRQISFTQCTFDNNKHYQQLTSLIGQQANQYEASLLVINDSGAVQTQLTFDELTVQKNSVIGDASLFHIEGVSQTTVQNSAFMYNGIASTQNFTSVGTLANIAPIQINLSQGRGIFQLLNCGLFNPRLNTFEYNAASFGTAFTLNSTKLYSQANSFSYHIAVMGSIAQIFGDGQLFIFSESDEITFTIGTAFSIQIQDDLHISQTTFRSLKSQDAVGETVGLFSISKVGAFCLFSSQITSTQLSKIGQRSAFKTSNVNVWNQIWSQSYLDSRLSTYNQNAGVLYATSSYYLGSVNTMTYLTNVYQITAVSQPTSMWMIDTTVQNQMSTMAGVVYLQASKLYISTSDGSYQSPNLFASRLLAASVRAFKFNQASVGAGVAMAIQNSQLTIKGCNFVSNSGNAGGVVQLSSSYLNMTQSTVQSNKGTYGGFLYSQNSYYYLDTSFFQGQNSSQASFIYSVGFKSETPQSFIGNVYISQNFAIQNIITLIQGNVSMVKTLFTDNISQGGSNGISAISSVITATGLVARQTQQLPTSQILAESGSIHLSYQSSLTLTDSKIQNQQGTMAGAIYVVGGSTLSVTNSDISNNQVLYGSIIQIVRSSPTIINAVTMSQNTGGPNIMITGSNLNITGSTLKDTAHTLLYAKQSNITVQSSTFENGGSFSDLGGAIYCECKTFIVVSSKFNSNQAAAGGAIYLVGGSSGAQKIYSNVFSFNTAQQGGAVAVITANQLDVRGNNFTQNQAVVILPITVASSNLPSSRAQGGGLYSLCQDSYNQTCQILIRANTFTNNLAQNEGASYIYLNNAPILDPNEPNNFISNIAAYGLNLGASFATSLQLISISNNDPLQTNKTLNQAALSLSNFAVVSGVSLSFLIGLYDVNNQTLSSENQATATFRVQAVSYNQTVSLFGAQAVANRGIFNFTGLIISTTPGTKFILELNVALPYTSNSKVTQNSINQLISIDVRPCGRGEAFTVNETCQICPPGTYDLLARSQIHDCLQCQQNSICFGKDKIAPIKNYWRPDINSIQFLHCMNNVACLQGNQTQQLGRCADHYTGVQCAICTDNYYQSGADHLCKQCGVTGYVYVIVVVCGVILALIAVFLTTVNSRYAKYDMNYSPAVLKIWIMHTQLVWFFWMIQRWSANRIQLINAVLMIQTFLDFFMEKLTKCWLIEHGKANEMTLQLRYFWTFTPILTFVVGVLVITVLLFILKRQKLFLVQSTQIFFIVIYLSQMRTIWRLLNVFNCVEVLGQQLLEEDRSVVCYESAVHKKLVAFSIVSLVVWVFVLPLMQVILFFVRRVQILNMIYSGWARKTLSDERLSENKSTNLMFSVVINGFKPNAFYWDQITLLKNTGLCVVYVTFSAYFKGQQYIIMLSLIIFMLFMLSVELIVKPFQKQNLNFLSSTSSIAIIGLFFAELLISVDTMVGNDGISITKAVSIMFVLLPHLVFYFFVLKEFQQEITQWCFYRSQRLFRLITCGLVSRLRYGQTNENQLEKHEESLQQMVTKGAEIFKSLSQRPDTKQIVRPEQVVINLQDRPDTSRNQIDSSRARLVKGQQLMVEMSEEKLNQDVEAQVWGLVRDSRPESQLVRTQRRGQLSNSINILEYSTQQKILVDEEAIRPESSKSLSEEDDVVIGSVDFPASDRKLVGPFDAYDEIFQQKEEGAQSNADVSVSYVHLEDRKEAQNFKSQLRSSTLPPAGVSSKARNRVQGTVSIAVRDVDNESRPETQNSERTVVNNGQPNYVTSDKGAIIITPDRRLKKDAAEIIQVASRIDNFLENDNSLPRFGSNVFKRPNELEGPQESQEGENVEQSPLKLRNAFSIQEDAPPIRTTTKRKFV